ncbi:MAG: hypothetical protein FWF60_00710 [Oscillospiraceae bacterium]|nr:hypothetical protein [Oscillospiraceae bacterium]
MKHAKKALFRGSSYEPACELCRFGKSAPDGSSVLCSVRGVMRKQSSCKKYEYDPLKRKPNRAPLLPEYDPEEFAL